MSEHGIYLVREVRQDSSEPLMAFETRSDAAAWRDEYVADYDELDAEDWADYHVGMGGKAKFPINEVPINRSVDTDNG